MGEPAGGGYCVPTLGALRTIEGVWIRTKIIRSVLRHDAPLFEVRAWADGENVSAELLPLPKIETGKTPIFR